MNARNLIRVRSYRTYSRREFGIAMSALGGIAASGLAGRAASAEVEVTFLGWQGYDAPLLVDDWVTKNGVKLATTYIGNNDEIVTKLTSGGIGQIDLVTPYMGYIPLLAKTGLIEPVDTSLVPNLDKVLPLFRNDSNLNVDGVLYGVPFTWGSAPMMYDPATYPTPPSSWKDLLKPEFTGKVGMMDDPLVNLMLAAVVGTDAEFATLLTADQLKAAVDFLIAIKKQSRLVAVSWGDLADALSRGDITVTFSGWETIKKFCADKGKTIEYTYPSEGTFAWLDNYCIAKDAPHKAEAHLLANEIISVPAQKNLAETAIQAIVNSDAIAALDPAIKALYPYDDIENFGKKAKFFAFPPAESDGKHATYTEWLAEYDRFKTA
jgi:spermidine/putrescine transport system substrate-binding protein